MGVKAWASPWPVGLGGLTEGCGALKGGTQHVVPPTGRPPRRVRVAAARARWRARPAAACAAHGISACPPSRACRAAGGAVPALPRLVTQLDCTKRLQATHRYG
eukprot:1153605-Prymnesium_polylepis.3